MAKNKKSKVPASMKFVKGKLREQAIEKGTYNLNKSNVFAHKKKKESKEACRKFRGNQDEENN